MVEAALSSAGSTPALPVERGAKPLPAPIIIIFFKMRWTRAHSIVNVFHAVSWQQNKSSHYLTAFVSAFKDGLRRRRRRRGENRRAGAVFTAFLHRAEKR